MPLSVARINFHNMSLIEIQQAVESLSPEERLRLTAWMVSRYPVLKVEQLMTRATTLVDSGEWVPSAPSEDNRPKGKMLDHALRVAEELDLGK